MTKIHGADYLPSFNQVARTKHEWQELLRAALKAGGQRRVENNETFIHGPGGLLRHEVYANIPEPSETP